MFFGRKSPSNLVFFLLIIKVLFSGASRERSLWDAVFRKSTTPFLPWRPQQMVPNSASACIGGGGGKEIALAISIFFFRSFPPSIEHIVPPFHGAAALNYFCKFSDIFHENMRPTLLTFFVHLTVQIRPNEVVFLKMIKDIKVFRAEFICPK